MSHSRSPRGGASPTTLGSWIAISLAGIAWSLTLSYSLYAIVVATIGWASIGLALFAGDRRVLSVGALGSVVGMVLVAGDGASVLVVLVGVTAVVLAWDIGQNAIGLGRQLGQDGRTHANELSHAAASVGVGSFIVAVAVGASTISAGAVLLIAVAYLLLAGGLLVVALGPDGVLAFEWSS